jgi:hypothetical protein
MYVIDLKYGDDAGVHRHKLPEQHGVSHGHLLQTDVQQQLALQGSGLKVEA